MSVPEILGRTALFAEVPEAVLKDLAERGARRRYRKGAVVFVQGERGDRCYTILDGTVKISAYHPDGREALLAVLGPGDLFGELAVFDRAARSADATVLTDTELFSLDERAVDEAIRSHPELGIGLLRVLGARLRQTNEALQDAAFFDIAGRVARRLADLAEAHGAQDPDGTLIDIPLSQETLAQMVGATRESVNKALGSLRRRGLIARRGRRYLVPDVRTLRDRAR